jgi:hypothetical protein
MDRLEQYLRDELNWAAGFFDGEGCIGTYKEKARYCRLYLSISQIKWETLERFRRATGNHNKVRGPYDPNNSPSRKRQQAAAVNPRKSKPYYSYTAQGGVAVAVFNTLRPYLSPFKRADGDDAIAEFRAYREKLLGPAVYSQCPT